MLKEMKADFSSLNNKVNSHGNEIKQLECQMIKLSAQLEPKLFENSANEYTKSPRAENDKELEVVTRSGKISVGNVKVNDGTNTCEEEKDTIEI